MTKLTLEDLEVILTSFSYSKQRINDYPHDDYNIKQQKLAEITDVETKIRSMKKELKSGVVS